MIYVNIDRNVQIFYQISGMHVKNDAAQAWSTEKLTENS